MEDETTESPNELEPAEEADQEPAAEADHDRREFFAKAMSAGFGAVIVAVPVVAGVGTLLAPLGVAGQGGLKVRLAGVDDLPADGTPKRFDVVADRKDAWTKYPKKAIGSVWLRKTPEGDVVAFNASCPHLGCAVGFDAEKSGFACPCHESVFGLDGGLLGKSVSPRGMDTLEVDEAKLAEGDVWVTFMNFKTTTDQKIPV